MRYRLIVLLCCFFYLSSTAQETSNYYLKENSFKEAVQLIEERQYLPAKKLFQEFLAEENTLGRQEYKYWEAKAEYYLAWISYKLEEPRAENDLLAFIEKHEGTAEARLATFNLGQLYYKKRRYKNALQWFEKVKIDDLAIDQVVEYNFKTAYSNFILKRFEKAKPLFAQIKSTESQYMLAANYYYGFIEFFEGNLESALESFNKAERSEIFDDVIPYYKAQIYYFKEDYSKVIGYLDPYLSNENVQYRKHLHHLVGKAYFKLEDYENAAKNFKLYADESRSLTKEEIYQIGVAYYKIGDFESSVEYLEELNNNTRDSVGQYAIYALADAYLKTGRYEEARNAFQSILLNRMNANIHQLTLFNYAKLSHELNYQKDAYLTIEDLIRMYPRSPYLTESKKLLIDVLFASNNYREALEILDNMESMNTDMKKAYQKIAYLQAVAYKNDNRIDASMDYVKRSLEYPLDDKILTASYYLSGELNYLKSNYSESIDQYLKFLQSPGDFDRALKMQATYSTAYAYMKMKKYKQAITYFDKAIALKVSGDPLLDQMYSDAFIRKGDSHLMNREYSSAISAYKKVVDNKWSSWDYATFQQALVEGLKGNSKTKIQLLLKLNQDVPKSLYADDALFYAAATQADIGENNNAISNFDLVINDYPESKWVVESYLRKGLLYFNSGNTTASINNFKHVIENYPNTNASRQSVKALKEVYVSLGQTQAYIDYINSVPYLNVTSGAQDSLLYSTAEEYYYKADCNNAVRLFGEYLDKFPKGIFNLRARYFRAACHMKSENYVAARKDYEFISEKKTNEFSELSLLRAAELNYYEFEDYTKSFKYYSGLEKVAGSAENKQLALKGIMRSSYKNDNFDKCIEYSNKILLNNLGLNALTAEANYYQGKIYYQRGKFTVALSHFQASASFENSLIGAESQYHVARIYYLRKDYQRSLNECFKTKNNFSNYEYWVVKSFVLMSDNYVELDNDFQARATLQSVVDNYTGDKQLLDEAKRKLAKLNEGSKQTPKSGTDSLYTIPSEGQR
ncbi:MAG: tetratricopeptide repeat protein [Chitinophagales bacterium]|nr:tetratricopeptide repeat protein [Chitinophagales bacterium]